MDKNGGYYCDWNNGLKIVEKKKCDDIDECENKGVW